MPRARLFDTAASHTPRQSLLPLMATDKGKAPATAAQADPLAAAPWVEKYRPRSLDDVAAHREIIDTSEWRWGGEGGVSVWG